MLKESRGEMSSHGLRGHETVIRLVGKRRKLTLSAITSKKAFQHEVRQEIYNTSSKSIKDDEEVTELPTALTAGSQLALEHNILNLQDDGADVENPVICVSWVQCPVCIKSVRGDAINSHLDGCLQGGVMDIKRKNKQLTLSQFGSCTAKLAGRCRSADEKQGNIGFVKLEPLVTIGLSHPIVISSQVRDRSQTRMNEKSKGLSVMKHEDGVGGGSQPVILSSQADDTLQTRRRLKSLTCVQKNADHCLEELVHEVESANSSVCLARSSGKEKSLEMCTHELDRTGCTMDPMSAKCLGAAISLQVPDNDCSCYCHLSSLNIRTTADDSEQDGRNQLVETRTLDWIRGFADGGEQIDTANMSKSDSSNVTSTHKLKNNRFIQVLDTEIVGRRFHRNSTCKEGLKVTVMREPDNPKDPNAIQIVPDETPCGPALGHLAKEISLHLSGLLDKGFLEVSGFVTGVPQQTFGGVPIRLLCKSKMPEEDFLRLDGAKDHFQKMLLAAENLHSHQRSSSGGVHNYQQNFLSMMRIVLERDSHLFKESEKVLLDSFSRLSDDAQRLFIRLYQRKGPWFRLLNIEYKDVTDVSVASEELLAAGFMTAEDNMDEDPEVALRKRFQILNVLELRQFVCTALFKKKSEATATKKDDLVDMAVCVAMQKPGNFISLSLDQSASTITKLLAEVTGKCIRVSDSADFQLWRLQRLFFLNGDSDLSAFLLVDMRLVKYPSFRCWRARNIFETREALLSYEKALELAQGMDMALECNDTETALKLLKRARYQMQCEDGNQAYFDTTPTFLARFSASYVYRNVCTLGVSLLERQRRYYEAVDVLRQLLSSKSIKSGRWGYWTVRLSMDLEHLGQKEESLQVAEKGVNDPWIRGGDRVALQRRVLRLGKPPRRWKKPPYAEALERTCKEVQIQGRPINRVTGMKSRFYGYNGHQCGVEELALQFYSSEEGGGWQGVHCEGGVWMTLFGLLMWDVLFADVPDVFQNCFQNAPLDLDTEVFFSSRESLIAARLATISEGDITDLLCQTWKENFGTRCRGVNWERHSLEELQVIASCIGGPGLSAICKLLAEDYAGWTAGMPDLLLWRTNTSMRARHLSQVVTHSRLCITCGCNSVEVGPLAPSQERCMASCLLESGDRMEKLTGLSKESFYTSRRLTSTLSSNRDSCRLGEAKLVEVKGPRDRLSEQQRAWVWILMSAGLAVEVLKVLEKATE